ncbi:MAG: D-hexose-6-phosphate mutarotase [Candidatus Korobacteraceae bacterium]
MKIADIAELQRRMEIPGAAHVLPGNGGLAKVQIATPIVAGEVYLHGAHVTSWKPAGKEEVFFVSENSLWQDGHAIRGGVPICFPWFGDKADDPHAPAHGFVRTKEWKLEKITAHGADVSVELSTESGPDTRQWYAADFRLVYRVTYSSDLTLELIMLNTGREPLRFEEALHAYHNVGDAAQASIAGLDGIQYLDKTDSFREKTQAGEIHITRETDRVYLNTSHPLTVTDTVLQRRIVVTKKNSLSTVIWNPWSEKALTMSDMGQHQWKRMLCIETSNVGEFAVSLAPGQQHTMKAIVSLS